MNAWMRWPQAIMNEQVLVGGGTVASLKANCEAMTDSVLQFSAIRYGLMVAALIFATRAVLARKCRYLAAEIVAYPGAPAPDLARRGEVDLQRLQGREPAGVFRALPDVSARAGDCAAIVGGGEEVGVHYTLEHATCTVDTGGTWRAVCSPRQGRHRIASIVGAVLVCDVYTMRTLLGDVERRRWSPSNVKPSRWICGPWSRAFSPPVMKT